jgi:hypothetical protein
VTVIASAEPDEIFAARDPGVRRKSGRTTHDQDE